MESLPTSAAPSTPEALVRIVAEVQTQYDAVAQPALPGLEPAPDIAAVVAQTVAAVQRLTIDIPRIVDLSPGVVTTGYHPFTLNTAAVHLQPVSRDLLLHYLQQPAGAAGAGRTERGRAAAGRLSGAPTHGHPRGRLRSACRSALQTGRPDGGSSAQLLDRPGGCDENVVRYHQKRLANQIYSQMALHRWERTAGYATTVTRGFTTLKPSAVTAPANQPVRSLHTPPVAGEAIAALRFGGFTRCLYNIQKFDSDPERRLAILLERETAKWLHQVLGQFPANLLSRWPERAGFPARLCGRDGERAAVAGGQSHQCHDG